MTWFVKLTKLGLLNIGRIEFAKINTLNISHKIKY